MDNVTNACSMKLVDIDISSISVNPYQPRKVYTDADIESLSLSISKNGLLVPITVIELNEGYELLFGHRRLLATKKSGLGTILAIIQPNVCEKLEPALIENMQRKNLCPLDEAEAFKSLCSDHNYSLKDLSQKFNKSVSLLSETLKMNVIPADVKLSCRSLGHLKFRFLKALSQYGGEDSIRDAYQYFLEHGTLPPRNTRKYGEDETYNDLLNKLTEIVNELSRLELDADKDKQFLQQIREQVDVLKGLYD